MWESGATVLSSMVNICSIFDVLLEYRSFSSISINLSNIDRDSIVSVSSTSIPSYPPSTSKQIRGIPFVKLTKVSMICLATTGSMYLSYFESSALAGRVSKIAASALLPCLRLNVPVFFDRSSCEISRTVPIKIWYGKTFYLELPYQSLLPLPRMCTLNISPLVSL